MIVRVLGNKLKFCRLYDDDVFGNRNIRPKSGHKILDVIYKDLFKKDLYYRNMMKKLDFFIYKLRNFVDKYFNYYMKKLDSSILYLKTNKIENINFFLFDFFKKIPINVNILLYFFKQLKTKGTSLLDKAYSKKKFNIMFNYRVDEGKPRRERKRVTLYCTRLLTRHRLRFFASRMTVRQFRSYIKKKRGSKYLGMFFIWLLETRIDTIFYRLNLQASSGESRQYIKHFGVLVNNIFINIPSFRIGFYDCLSLLDRKQMYRFLLFKFYKNLIFMCLPSYYEVNFRIMTMCFFVKPHYKMLFFPFSIDVQRLGGLGERF